jgi:hypothetical protein
MKKKELKFLDRCFNNFKKLLNLNFEEIKKKIINLKKLLLELKKSQKNTIFWQWWKCRNCKSF